MSSVLVARQPVISFLSKTGLCIGQRNWINLVHSNRMSTFARVGRAGLLPQSILEQNFQLRQQHVSSSESADPQESVKKPPKFYRLVRDNVKRKVHGNNLRAKQFFDLLDETFERWVSENRTLSDSDWDSLLDNSVNGEESMILKYDAAVMQSLRRRDLPDFAISFIDYVRKTKVPSLKALTALIAVCGKKYPDITFKEYEELQKHHSVIDFSNYENLIFGFSKTKEWKKCLQFLEEERQAGESEFQPGLAHVIEAAVAHNDPETLDQLLTTYVNSHNTVLPQRFATAMYNAWSDGRISGETLLKYLSTVKGYLTLKQAECLEKEMKSKDGGEYQSFWGKIVRSQCSICGGKLKGEPVTDSQVKLLEERMKSNVTSTKHIHIYSSPEEYEYFCSFLDDRGPYEIVIDAANYFYHYIPHFYENKGRFEMRVSRRNHEDLWGADSKRIKRLLISAGAKVQETYDQNGHPILSLSGKRADMLRARKIVMATNKTVLLDKVLEPFKRILFVCNNGTIIRLLRDKYDFGERYHMYTPHQKSDDDFFALATALHSGPDCYLLSGDNYKALKSQIGTDVIPLFEQWQRRRQIFITLYNFKMPQDHDFCVQEDADGWHVPYVTEEDTATGRQCYYFMPNTLLCLRKKHWNRKNR